MYKINEGYIDIILIVLHHWKSSAYNAFATVIGLSFARGDVCTSGSRSLDYALKRCSAVH